ncbi:hypothetical protein [Actinomadura rubrisoli]|uniref:Uncharacterized protein n=1 Tax=Actinomadura rubrisoli TaxID=2530368 RepID=A0A4R5CCA6_9ACTN|nr:hypothetical protein [Actinomadura rubrisoli]TDD97611.1 hypothetical protein E1298_00850 [Actinomadura rubrisoli]
MRKIPTVFLRDWDNNPKHVTREPNPECAWVFAGAGDATRKYDGTCVMLDEHGDWWARREVKPGKTPPPGFVEVGRDEETGKAMGWEPIAQSGFAKHFEQALDHLRGSSAPTPPGTYELIGPKINGNPEHRDTHTLVCHAHAEISPDDRDHDLRTYDTIRDLVAGLATQNGWEGLVYHAPDGRMAKIKAKDFPA